MARFLNIHQVSTVKGQSKENTIPKRHSPLNLTVPHPIRKEDPFDIALATSTTVPPLFVSICKPDPVA